MQETTESIAARRPLLVAIRIRDVDSLDVNRQALVRKGAKLKALKEPIAEVRVTEYVRFLGDVADKSEIPLAVQNAPGLMATSLSNGGLKALNRQHPNVCLLKGEGPATYLKQLLDDTRKLFGKQQEAE